MCVCVCCFSWWVCGGPLSLYRVTPQHGYRPTCRWVFQSLQLESRILHKGRLHLFNPRTSSHNKINICPLSDRAKAVLISVMLPNPTITNSDCKNGTRHAASFRQTSIYLPDFLTSKTVLLVLKGKLVLNGELVLNGKPVLNGKLVLNGELLPNGELLNCERVWNGELLSHGERVLNC